MSLTVGIDARKVRDFGIGRYIEGLLGGLAGLEGDERYVLFLREETLASLPGRLPDALREPRFRAVPCRAGLYSLRELVVFRGAAARYGLDVLHFPHYVRAIAPGCPVAVTIHDPIHLVHPPSRPAWVYAAGMMRWSAWTAATLFTVSDAARDELSAALGISPARFVVTPNGVGPPFAPPPSGAVDAFRSERGLDRPFVLCVASHRPHKNLAGAAEAFRTAELDDAELVVPARDAAAAAGVEAFRSVDRPFRVLEGVSDDELPRLYAAARIVLVPSLHEGFGLPGLEAAACGAAVLATDIPAHREVLAGAAELVAPEDIAPALRALWRDDDTRRSLAERGPRRAAEFRWDRTARLTLDGYRRAART
jgi:glycosyltransferase involved in cell wall biosynthesis